MIVKLIGHVFSAILGLYLISYLISSIDFVGDLKTLVVIGLIMGIINFLIRPVLKTITFPLKFLTLGISSFIINIGLVWLVVAVLFQDFFIVRTWFAYVWVFLTIWLLSMIFISNKK